MATIDGMLLELNDRIFNANVVKEMVITRLLSDSLITEKQANNYKENWQIIIYKNSWFKKLMSKDKKAWYYKYVNFSDKSQDSKNITIS
jgi:hypothetical protein